MGSDTGEAGSIWNPTPLRLLHFQISAAGSPAPKSLSSLPPPATYIGYGSFHSTPRPGWGAYAAVVNRILDMFIKLRSDCQIVIGGDFNLTVTESPVPSGRQANTAERQIHARLRDELGLLNCWQTANAGAVPVQTLRWTSDSSIPFHCDGIFVPGSWAEHLHSCNVPCGEKWNQLSDHNPVVAQFNQDVPHADPHVSPNAQRARSSRGSKSPAAE